MINRTLIIKQFQKLNMWPKSSIIHIMTPIVDALEVWKWTTLDFRIVKLSSNTCPKFETLELRTNHRVCRWCSPFYSKVSIVQVLKVCRGGCGNKPAMWIDGGIHARYHHRWSLGTMVPCFTRPGYHALPEPGTMLCQSRVPKLCHEFLTSQILTAWKFKLNYR